jgi:hypothetical protein
MADGLMPLGSPLTEIREDQVRVAPGNVEAPQFQDDAAATLVWTNYQEARNFVEDKARPQEWQETDILYQSPIPNHFLRVEQGRPARVPRFLVAKNTRTLARAVKRGLFAEQYPFFLRPGAKTNQAYADAWTYLLGVLLKRMKFQYHVGLLIDCQTLQGTGLGKLGVEERTVIKRGRRRKKPPATMTLPTGDMQEVPTQESDEFEPFEEERTETWPFFEYRRLGTSLADPKWCTPDQPDESAGYWIDTNFVNFGDLQEMRKLDCYKNLPSDETLKQFFFDRAEGSAATGSQIEDAMTAQGSLVTHAQARNRQTDHDPLKAPLRLIEQWDRRSVKAILEYEGRHLCIRNEDHQWDSSLHVSATWWPIDNSGYGIGIGKLNGPDQRINQGIINECLKMIAYPFNAPILYADNEGNAPTQNTIARFGGYQRVSPPRDGDVRKAMAFMPMPEIPQDAWRMLELSQKGGEDLSGANSQMLQGNLGGPGSSAARTATGASRIAGMADQNVADPIESVANGVIIPTIEFLIQVVKQQMPLAEIREILGNTKYAAVIEKAIDQEQFLEAEFEVSVLAGQKLAARQGIQQLIPIFLQILQQPQLLEYLHQRGETIDFQVMIDLMMQVGELTQQPDIIRKLTPQEQQSIQAMNPGMQQIRAKTAVEQVKGANKQQEIQTQGEVDRANKAAEIVMQHAADGIPLERAATLLERGEDENALRSGLPDAMQG